MYDNLCKYALYSRKMYVVYYVYVSPYSCISIHFSPVHMKLKMLQNIIPTYIRQRAQKDHCRTYSFHIPVNIEYFVQHCLTSLFSGLSAASKKWSLFTLRPKRVPGGWVHKKSFAKPKMDPMNTQKKPTWVESEGASLQGKCLTTLKHWTMD